MVCAQVPPVYGGAGTQALALAGVLESYGHEIDILTQNQARVARTETRGRVRITRGPGERVARLLPKRLAEVFRTLVYVAWLIPRLAFRRYDVYHVHGCYWFALPPALISRLRRAPLIVKVTRVDDDDAVTVVQRRFWGIKVGRLAAAPLRIADAVVVLNAEGARRHHSVFPNRPAVQIPNGVDTGRFEYDARSAQAARAELGIDPDDDVALFVGYLTPLKGIDELLDAWQMLRTIRDGAEARERSITLLLVGPGHGAYRDLSTTAANRARRMGDGVRVFDHIPTDAMPAVYAAADVFVLPSRSEGMPNSLLEALAAGLIVIATPIPGIVELIDGDPSSLLLDDLTPDAIEAALVAAFDRKRRRAADRSSRLPASLSLDEVAARYSELYDSLTGKHGEGLGRAASVLHSQNRA
jgi:glycosyltransferase involved in cell wall biosynthesis